MMLTLTVDDLFAMAIEFERNGAAFYARAAASAAGRPHAGLLHRLAAMEQMHEKRFAELRAAVSQAGSAESSLEPAGEKMAYLKALADTRVFPVATPPADALGTASDLVGAFRFAIEREKDSVVFYATMQELVPLHQGREQIRAIIAEELGHVHLLTAELAGLLKNSL
ncbi:MAG TPA: ferritin family protein [Candidatus Ozemobacteraceae bacterium]|nr:ferritin family protein [Candidatus Ozemobacteraceae bacterium]